MPGFPSFKWIAFPTITIYGNSILSGTSFGFTKAKITCESSKIPSNLQLSDVKNIFAIKAMIFVQATRNFFCQKRPPNDCILKHLRCHSQHFEAVLRKLSIRSRLVAILQDTSTHSYYYFYLAGKDYAFNFVLLIAAYYSIAKSTLI